MLANPAFVATALEDGSLTIDGDGGAMARLFGLLEQPDLGFNIIEP